MATEKIVDAAEATRAHFDAEAADYDAQRPYRLHYAELQQVMLRAIPYPPEASFIVLELGIGTGLLTEQLLRRFPHATVEAYDLSEEMLARARQRLAPFGTRVKLSSGDFSTTLPKATYDLICSSLALHHLPRANRDRFYRRLGLIRVAPVQTQLGPNAPRQVFTETRMEGMVLVGMISVQHPLRVTMAQHGEVGIAVDDLSPQHVAMERQGSGDVTDQQVEAKPPQRTAVLRGGHPGVAGSKLHVPLLLQLCACALGVP